MSRPSWKPGRRHGTHRTRWPKQARVRSSPSTEVARAMPASGCRWSTWARLTRACIGVSIEGAAPPLPCRQKSNAATMSSSWSGPGYTPTSARSRSSRRAARPPSVSVPRSPPDPFDVKELDGFPRYRVVHDGFARRVAAGVVGVPRVTPEAVGAFKQFDHGLRGRQRAVHGRAHSLSLPNRRKCHLPVRPVPDLRTQSRRRLRSGQDLCPFPGVIPRATGGRRY